MDSATINRILARQGAEPSADNINRIIQMAASDPSILERYSMGTAPAQTSSGPGRQDIRGGSGPDDNAALLNLDRAITKSIQQTELPPPVQQAQAPPPPPQARAPQRQSIPGDENRPVGAPPFPNQAPQQPVAAGQAYDPSTGAPIPVPSGAAQSRAVPPDQASAGDMSGLLPAILGLFGAGGAAAYLSNKSRVPVPQTATPPLPTGAPAPTVQASTAPHMPQPAPQGPAHMPGGVPQSGPPGPGPQPYTGGVNGPHNPPPVNNEPPYMPPPNAAGQTPSDIARLRAEVDAENAQALQDAIKMKSGGKTAAQKSTEETLRRAGETVGRRK